MENTNTGFGIQPTQLGDRFVQKDGTFNIRKEGISYWRRTSLYSSMLQLSWLQFLGFIFVIYFVVCMMFTLLYWWIDLKQFTGLVSTTPMSSIWELFFFSTQTFTTVGYGRINPVGTLANSIASIQAMSGWLFFALVTGLLYGRFTRPSAFLAFSHNALISPYQGGLALMFRLVPYKSHHHLTDAKIVVNLARVESLDTKTEYKFYQLNLERSQIDFLSMNWTVVHPIDENSPLFNTSTEAMRAADTELYVQVSGFDPIFSNTVMQRTSYTSAEVIWNAKFLPMYRESEDGSTTIVKVDKLNQYELL
ncbi:MAG: ion channel [Chitinophagaceae bacterium]